MNMNEATGLVEAAMARDLADHQNDINAFHFRLLSAQTPSEHLTILSEVFKMAWLAGAGSAFDYSKDIVQPIKGLL